MHGKTGNIKDKKNKINGRVWERLDGLMDGWVGVGGMEPKVSQSVSFGLVMVGGWMEGWRVGVAGWICTPSSLDLLA